MKPSQRFHLNRLAEKLVTPERYAPTWPNFVRDERRRHPVLFAQAEAHFRRVAERRFDGVYDDWHRYYESWQ